MTDAGGALAPPGRQERRVQSFAAQQLSNSTGALGTVHFREDALLVIGGEHAPLGLGHDFRVGVGLRIGVGLAAIGTGAGTL